ncbi:unnamed protein product, partial [Ectocarpus sp. 8 AP-2014]
VWFTLAFKSGQGSHRSSLEEGRGRSAREKRRATATAVVLLRRRCRTMPRLLVWALRHRAVGGWMHLWRPISIDSIYWTIGRAALVPPSLDTRARSPVNLLLEQQCFSKWLCVLVGVFVRENDALLPSFFLQGRAAAVDSTHVVAKIARWFSREDGRWLSFLMEEWVGNVPVPTPERRRVGGVSTFSYWCGGYGARLWWVVIIICCPTTPPGALLLGTPRPTAAAAAGSAALLVVRSLRESRLQADAAVQACSCGRIRRAVPNCDGCLFSVLLRHRFLNLCRLCFVAFFSVVLVCLCVRLLAAMVEEKLMFQHDQGRSWG